MPMALNLVPDPRRSLLASNGVITVRSNIAKLPCPTHCPNFEFRFKKSILCAAKRRNRYGIVRSGKLMLESACIIASKLRLLPEPVELLLREFGGGNGGGNGLWTGRGGGGGGGGGFGGWNRRKGMKFGILGILAICCAVGFWLGTGKELGIDDDAFLAGLGFILLGLSVEGLKRGARDWILGFSCCAFLVLVLKRDEFRAWVRGFGRVKRNGRR